MTAERRPFHVLVLVDGWNHYSAAKQLIGDIAGHLRYDLLGAYVQLRLVALGVLPKVELEPTVRVYLGYPDQESRKNLVSKGLTTKQWVDEQLRIARRVAAQRAHGVIVRRLPSMNGHWTHLYTPERQLVKVSKVSEKGADTMLAFDAAVAVCSGQYDVIVLCTEDRDFKPVLEEVREICTRERRNIALFTAFPVSRRGRDFSGGAFRVGGVKEIHLHEQGLRDCVALPRRRRRR